MDELKLRAGEKIGALHEAAKTAAGSSRSRVEDVVNHTIEALSKIREAFNDIWHHELIAEGRERIAAWTRDAAQRIREGAPPLSPVVLYEELVALFRDRVWRRSVVIFLCGAALGGGAGLCAGLRCAGAGAGGGPHARALVAHPDQSVILVDDATAPAPGAGEVLVRVQAFSVCPRDRAALRGRGAALRALAGRAQPVVGRGFAGVVLDVGHGVGELELGDEVWGCVSEWSGGAAAELLTIRSTRVSKRPRGLAADAAAALPFAGALALHALDRLRCADCKGKRVVVCGAASGEGCALLQLLCARGAHVSALAPRSARQHLRDLGAHEFVELEVNSHATASWSALAQLAARAGPWDAVLACAGAGAPPADPAPAKGALKATAARDAVVDLRPNPLLSDRLPIPLSIMFAASFYTLRVMRWIVGCGRDTDFLEDRRRLAPGLAALAALVDDGALRPVLDKVYLPQDFESALAHACSDEAIGTTVIRFP